MLREYERGEKAGASQVKRVPKPLESAKPGAELWGDRVALRKCASVDDRLLKQTPTEPGALLSHLERGQKKFRDIHVSMSDYPGLREREKRRREEKGYKGLCLLLRMTKVCFIKEVTG